MLGTGFFDSKKYDSVRSPYSLLVVQTIQELFSDKRDLRLAEVGAGSGKFTEALLNAGLDIKELNIIEPDSNGIKIHKEKFSGINIPIFYYNTTSDSTGLDNNYLDAIFIGHAFHWFDIKKTRVEFSQILKPKGKVFILGRFLDENDPVSAEYISLTRWGNRKNGFQNNIEAYSENIMTSFFGHKVEKTLICSETEKHSQEQLVNEIEVRIDSSGDPELQNNLTAREIKKQIIKDFYNKNNIEGYVPLKFTTFYFCSEII